MSVTRDKGPVTPEQIGTETATKERIIGFRAFLVGIPLLYFSGIWIFWGELTKYTFLTWAAPFCNAVFILMALTLINLPLRKYLPWFSLNKLEMLAVYVMVSVGSALISSDMQGILVTLIGWKAWFADATNNYDAAFTGVLPEWLMVNDKNVLFGFYKGGDGFLKQGNYIPWIKPIAAWTLFIWALLLMMLCVGSILRKAWVDRERLTFPIVALPMAMAEEPETFFRNKLLWIGFAIAFGMTLINGLSFLYPGFPEFAIKRQDFAFQSGGPLDALSPIRVSFYFFAITLGFIMPLDLSFSLYFFYFLYKFQAVFVKMIGVPPETGFPYTASQAFGAYMAIFLMAMWGLRGHLKNVWRTAFGDGDPNEDADEPMKYKWAIIGFGLSSLFLVVFSVMAGMKPVVAFIFLGIYLALCVMISRIRAEFGFPVHDMHEMGPGQTLTRLFVPQNFDKQTLGAFSLMYWFNRVYRSHPMPHQMEGMKLAGNDGRAQRAMLKVILIAGMVAVPICFWVYLDGFYKLGAATANINTWGRSYGGETFGQLNNWLKSDAVPNWGQSAATAFGFAFAFLLSSARRHFVGFPFHPLAYAVANSWGMQNLWLPITIGSICKAIVLRSLGLPGYRKALMFFFGLMLGEFAAGCGWQLYGMAANITTYQFWP